MALSLANLYVMIKARGITRLKTRLNIVNKELGATQAKMLSIQSTAKIAFIGAAAAMGFAIFQAAKFQKQLAMVATMLDETSMKFMPAYATGLRRLSVQYGESTETLAKGLYDILSASIPASKAMMVLEASAQAAAAGMTTTAVAVDAATTIVNSFSISADRISEINDKIFQTVKDGKITFEEYANNVGKLAATANIAGITLEEMNASIATLSRGGINADRAMAALVGMVRSFLRPTAEAQKMARQWGIDLSITALKANGLAATLGQLNELTVDQIRMLFPNIRGLKAVAAAMNDLEGFSRNLQSQYDSMGKTQEAFDKTTKTMMHSLKQLGQSFLDFAKDVGLALEPLMNAITALLKSFSKMSGGTKKTISWLIGSTVVLVGMSLAIKGITVALGFMVDALSIFSAKAAVATTTMTAMTGQASLATKGYYSLATSINAASLAQGQFNIGSVGYGLAPGFPSAAAAKKSIVAAKKVGSAWKNTGKKVGTFFTGFRYASVGAVVGATAVAAAALAAVAAVVMVSDSVINGPISGVGVDLSWLDIFSGKLDEINKKIRNDGDALRSFNAQQRQLADELKKLQETRIGLKGIDRTLNRIEILKKKIEGLRSLVGEGGFLLGGMNAEAGVLRKQVEEQKASIKELRSTGRPMDTKFADKIAIGLAGDVKRLANLEKRIAGLGKATDARKKLIKTLEREDAFEKKVMVFRRNREDSLKRQIDLQDKLNKQTDKIKSSKESTLRSMGQGGAADEIAKEREITAAVLNNIKTVRKAREDEQKFLQGVVALIEKNVKDESQAAKMVEKRKKESALRITSFVAGETEKRKSIISAINAKYNKKNLDLDKETTDQKIRNRQQKEMDALQAPIAGTPKEEYKHAIASANLVFKHKMELLQLEANEYLNLGVDRDIINKNVETKRQEYAVKRHQMEIKASRDLAKRQIDSLKSSAKFVQQNIIDKLNSILDKPSQKLKEALDEKVRTGDMSQDRADTLKEGLDVIAKIEKAKMESEKAGKFQDFGKLWRDLQGASAKPIVVATKEQTKVLNDSKKVLEDIRDEIKTLSVPGVAAP